MEVPDREILAEAWDSVYDLSRVHVAHSGADATAGGT
jgi:hypothetical protein